MVLKTANIIFLLLCVQKFLSAQVNNTGSTDAEKANIFAICDEVADPARQVGNIDANALASLPIGIAKEINGSVYVIAIDSAWFTPNGAFFNAYAALQLPGSTQKLAFAAKGIQFNPQGVIGGAFSRLMLVSDHIIGMGPYLDLHLPGNGANYIEWDCNGFNAVHIKGDFIFSENLLEPDQALTSDTKVKATLEVHTNDIHNIVAQVSITPFTLKGLKDFGFSISNAVVDLSDKANAPSVVFPAGYTQIYDENPLLWRGFFVQNFTVRLPEELKRGDAPPITVEAHNLLIDDAGISAVFGITNAVTIDEGDMHGWPFSVDLLSVEILSNNLVGGTLKGAIQVPALDNTTIGYTASVHKNFTSNKADYLFALNAGFNGTMSSYYAQLTILNSSQIIVQRKNNHFKPSLILNGNIKVSNSDIEIATLTVQSLTLVTEAPFITNGLFSLTTGDGKSHKVANFPVSISALNFGIYNGQPALGGTIGFNLGDTSNVGFAATTTFRLLAKPNATPIAGYNDETVVKTSWAFDKFMVDNIYVKMNTQPFGVEGNLMFFSNEPTYGKGFYGDFVFSFGKLLETDITVTAVFGKKEFKYWSFDIGIPLNRRIPSTNVIITQLRGGLSYHMKPNKTNEQIIALANSGGTSSGSGVLYIPDESIGIGIRAGVLFNYLREEILNGDALLSVVFNSSGGLNNITFSGIGYMLVKRSERGSSGKYARGSLFIGYDAENKIFDFNLNAYFMYTSVLTGMAYTKVHIAPDKWYVWIGRPSNPAYLNLAGIATAQSYLMVGQELEPMPAPPSQLTQIISDYNLDNQRNVSEISQGNGFATGMQLSASFDYSFGIDVLEFYAAGSVGAGFDMNLFKYNPSVHCEGSSSTGIGINNWYLNGQLYAWLSINAGVRGDWKGIYYDFTILSGNAAILLQGKMPKPSYMQGLVHLDATVLEFIHVNFDFNFDWGTNCNIVNG